MAKELPPLTEPVIVPCLFVTGFGLEIADDVVRFVAWSTMPELGGEMVERRIVLRFAIPNETARNLAAQLRRSLTKGGH